MRYKTKRYTTSLALIAMTVFIFTLFLLNREQTLPTTSVHQTLDQEIVFRNVGHAEASGK